MNSRPRPLSSHLARDVSRVLGGFLITALLAGDILCAESGTTNHWAFVPLRAPQVPAPSSPAAKMRDHPIDRFITQRLAVAGATLMPSANRTTLIRRLSYDLRGLPPSPEEVAEFVADTRVDAWERWVEAFMASPAYGERWGRHWLDIAAYADSNGYFNADSDRPYAYKYRDYVVRSIQADKPFDRFIQEQIAGDELVGYVRGGDLTPAMIEPLIATGFLRNVPDGSGESDGNPLEVKVDRYTVLEGTVQQLGSAFLGVTLQCARCHEHKFEPVRQEEYYGLQAILRPGLDPDSWLKPSERVLEVGTKVERDENHRAHKQYERDIKTLKESLTNLGTPFRRQWIEENLQGIDESTRKKILQAWEKPEKDRDDAAKALLAKHAAQIEIPTDKLDSRFPEYAVARSALEKAVSRVESAKPPALERLAAFHEPLKEPPVHHLLVRGNHATEGVAIEPTVPVSMSPVARAAFGKPANLQTTGRRLALAQWLTDPDNPIVARVLVNRVWSFHFGQGLVPTLENLGRSGTPPTSPALVDWLATEFIRSGWSLKHLHRLILSSATWRQETRTTIPETLPGVLSAGPRRLDAEALRDAMLSVSGELDRTIGGPYIPIRVEGDGQISVDESTPGAFRRTLYLQQRRTQPATLLQVFDGPAHNPVCVQRVQSTVALQSLAMLNSDFVRQRARAFAKRLLAMPMAPSLNEIAALDATETRIVQSIRLAYSRDPRADEIELARRFLQHQSNFYIGKDAPEVSAWTDYCQMLLASNEFLYVE